MGTMQMPKISTISYSVNIPIATVERYWCLPGFRCYQPTLRISKIDAYYTCELFPVVIGNSIFYVYDYHSTGFAAN